MEERELAPIPGFPGYFINRQAEVFSTVGRGTQGKLWRLRRILFNTGYYYVSLMTGPPGNRKPVQVAIHVLMLQTFVGPRPDAGYETRHLNGIRTDNRLENLAWGTKVENRADAIRHGTQVRGERQGQAKATEEIVRKIREQSALGRSAPSIGREFGLSDSATKAIIRRKSWKHVR